MEVYTEEQSCNHEISGLAPPNPSPPRCPSYGNWQQVAGYFDGDGSVTVHTGKLVVDFELQFSDNYFPQLEQLRSFLENKDVQVSRICKHTYERMYVMLICRDVSVMKATRSMVSHASKKHEELKTVLDYMENRITGDEAIGKFNELVLVGERIGKVRKSDFPFKRNEALKVAALRCGAATKIKTSKLTVEQQTTIQTLRSSGATLKALATEFRVSETTISKALSGGFTPNQVSH